MGKHEARITEWVLIYLRKLSQSHWEKKHGTPFGRIGHPDVYGCYHGRMVLIEIKVPGVDPSDRQEHELELWCAAGAIAGWADSVEEVHRMLQPYLLTEDKEISP